MSWLKDYLSFTRRERTAFIILVVLVTGFIFLPDLFPARQLPAALPADLKTRLAASKTAISDSDENDHDAGNQKDIPAPFLFDPNTLDEDGFVKLGLPGRTARTIINYRSKGGRFRKPDDLRKIYSLQKLDADRIIPYVRIATTTSSPGYASKKQDRTRSIQKIDINTATIEEWRSLPGIGEVLSARIVALRERLGGFASIDQVAKTYGLRDSVFRQLLPYLELHSPAVNKININSAYEKELMECNAINADIAKAIVIYRKQHGNYQSIEDLKKIVFITEDMFRQIAPCVKVN